VTEIRNLTDLAEYAQEQIERISRMQQDIAQYAGEGVSPERLVRAKTGPGGQLLDLHLDPAVMELHPRELTTEITAAITAAQRDYAERTNAIMEPVLGARPSERDDDQIEEGIRKLDALTENLERLMSRPELR
jgi:DNA-binding protein YbaB